MSRISKETIEEVRSVSILDLAHALGDNPKRVGKQYQVFCPNPEHSERTPDTYIEATKNIFKCFGGGGCGAFGNDSIKYYSWREHGGYEPKKHFASSVKGVAEIMGIPIKYEGGRVEKSTRPKREFTPRTQLKELTPQSEDVIDKVYRAFLSLCPIRREHAEEWVKERCYTKEEISALQLRSVPSQEEWIKIYLTMKAKGYPFERVPGFYQKFIPDRVKNPFPKEMWERDEKRQGHWVYVPSAGSGYFIPVRDRWGRITRMRVRRDSGKSKYVWFSSHDNTAIETNVTMLSKNGVSSGAPINVVVPPQMMGNWEMGTELSDVFKTDVVVATEGEHKSYISAKLLKVVFLGAPGVGVFEEILPIIQEWDVKKFVIAYDMDTLTRKDDSTKEVKKQQTLFEKLKEFSREVMKLGIDTFLWTWDISDGKGLDDLLLNKKIPVEVNLRTGERKLVNVKELSSFHNY